jgi:hypothetical protein
VQLNNTSPIKGDTLTATNNLNDVDGLSGSISYQWQRNGVDIGGATGSNYATVSADVGAVLTVVASYTDDQGTVESVSSVATATVTNLADTGGTTTDPEPDVKDDETETGEVLTDDNLSENFVDEDQTTPLIDEYSGDHEPDETVTLIIDQEITENTEEILYLTDENDSEGQRDRENNSGYVYYDNDLFKEITAQKYLDLNYKDSKISLELDNLPDFSSIDFESNELRLLAENGDYDRLRQEIDEAFSAEQQSETMRANIITATTATFTIGIVSYLLRAGSLAASMISTLPLWRGFDPIVIFTGKKKTAEQKDKTDASESKAEDFFDGDAA